MSARSLYQRVSSDSPARLAGFVAAEVEDAEAGDLGAGLGQFDLVAGIVVDGHRVGDDVAGGGDGPIDGGGGFDRRPRLAVGRCGRFGGGAAAERQDQGGSRQAGRPGDARRPDAPPAAPRAVRCRR